MKKSQCNCHDRCHYGGNLWMRKFAQLGGIALVATVESLLTDPFVSGQSYLHVFQSPSLPPSKTFYLHIPVSLLFGKWRWSILKRKLNFGLFTLSLGGNPLIGKKIGFICKSTKIWVFGVFWLVYALSRRKPTNWQKNWLYLQINQNMSFWRSQRTAGTKKELNMFYRKQCSVLEALYHLFSKS